jgi:hypothetical protein
MSRRTARPFAWSLFTLGLGLWLVGGVFAWLTRDLSAQTSWSGSNLIVSFAFGATLLTYPLVGLLIALRRPETPIGWILLVIGVCWGLASTTSYADYGLRLHPGTGQATALAAVVGSAMWAPAIGLTGTILILLFPDGRLPGHRWRWVARLSLFGIVAGTVALLVTPGDMKDNGYPGIANPLGVSSSFGTVIDAAHALLLLIPVAMAASAVSLVVRFRNSGHVERQQIKWLAAAAAAVAGIYLVVMPLSAVVPADSSGHAQLWIQTAQDVALISFALIPTAIGIAVLRHRLYEIDVIVRKTLVYAALVVALGLVYLGGIALIGGLVRAASGQQGSLTVALSTLAVAAAFQPFRARIQRAVDRRFYRSAYDAERAVRMFSERLREEIGLETLQDAVIAVVNENLQPRSATLWLRSQEGG